MVMKNPSRVYGDNYRNTRLAIKNYYPGFYRARVELTRDPKKMGRVKVRIPHLHGFLTEEGGKQGKFLKTSELPWALPGNFANAGYDYGQFIVPHVGTYIWISFEAGDPRKLIYFGGIPYKEGSMEKKYGHIGDVPDKINEDHPDFIKGNGYYAGEDGSYVRDIYEDRETTQDITRQVIYKSVKGHAIVADDTDKKESFTFIDRLGQMLKFISPITTDANISNNERRGVKSSYLENTLHSDDEKLEGSKAVVLLKDIDNQIVRMVAEDGKDKIEIMSRDAELTRNCGAYLSSEEDDVKFDIVAEDGDNRVIVIGHTKDSISRIFIVEGGVIKTHLKLDASDGMLVETLEKVKLIANEDVTVETQQKFIVNAKAGIKMETEGSFQVVANNSATIESGQLATMIGDLGISLQSPTTNIHANGKVWLEEGEDCGCPDCNLKHSKPLIAIGASADESIAEPEYVPAGMGQQWEDKKDELYI